MTKAEAIRRWEELKMEHTYMRDNNNNYGCFNIEACRNCNYVYNSRNAISCHASDGLIDCVQCVDCRNCTYCVGLTGSVFAICNVEYPEEEYYAILAEIGVNPNVDVGF